MLERPITAKDPIVSVVIPTIRGNSVQSLAGLRDQTLERYEVIVVRDESKNVSEARNLGIREANAGHIALTDDDTEPPENWLETAVGHLNNGVALLEGPVRIIEGDKEHLLNNSRDYRTCNLAFQKSVWEAVGGFDPRFAGWGEDTVFGWEVEDEVGLSSIRYSSTFLMNHIGPLRSTEITENDRLMRKEYPQRYFNVYRTPPTAKGKIGVGTLRLLSNLSPRFADVVHTYLT